MLTASELPNSLYPQCANILVTIVWNCWNQSSVWENKFQISHLILSGVKLCCREVYWGWSWWRHTWCEVGLVWKNGFIWIASRKVRNKLKQIDVSFWWPRMSSRVCGHEFSSRKLARTAFQLIETYESMYLQTKCRGRGALKCRLQFWDKYSRDCGWPRRPWPNAGRKVKKSLENQFFPV